MSSSVAAALTVDSHHLVYLTLYHFFAVYHSSWAFKGDKESYVLLMYTYSKSNKKVMLLVVHKSELYSVFPAILLPGSQLKTFVHILRVLQF